MSRVPSWFWYATSGRAARSRTSAGVERYGPPASNVITSAWAQSGVRQSSSLVARSFMSR